MKILILSCGTGGGHNSAALAIKEELDRRNIDNEFKEYLEIINNKVKNYVNSLYIKSTYRNGKVFKTVYKLGELYRKTKIKSPIYALNSFSKRKLYEYIEENKFDYVITTHLFAAQALTTIKKQKEVHFLAIATDYVCIPFWEEINPDYFIIPSEDLMKNFTDKDIDSKKLIPLGIPVSNNFSTKYDVNNERKELGLDINKKYISLLTGSMGFGGVTKVLEKLLKTADEDVNFIVSCGSNEKLLKTLEEKNYSNVLAIPFTKNIYKYMRASDIILSKPGGLTSTEVATMNKPLIHTMPIPGCENYNANYFSEKGMSIKCNTIDEIVDNTYKLLQDEKLKNSIIKNQKKYINKNSCKNICDFLISQF